MSELIAHHDVDPRAANHRRHRRKRTLAQSMVEFALVMPIFLTTMFGLMEGGRLAFSSMSLKYAIAHAARYGAVCLNLTTPCAATGSSGSPISVAQDAVNQAFTLGLPIGNVTVNGCTTSSANNCTGTFSSAATGDVIQVKATYSYIPVMTYAFPALPTITLHAQTQARHE